MRHAVVVGVGLVLVVGVVLGFSEAASARRDVELPYRFEQVWSSAVRLVRVDYGFRIVDRDVEAGYLLFDYTSGGRTVPGSIEVIRREVAERASVRVVLSIPAMPGYVERMMLDKLRRKVEEDHGPPPKAKKEPKAPEKEPGSGEGSSDSSS